MDPVPQDNQVSNEGEGPSCLTDSMTEPVNLDESVIEKPTELRTPNISSYFQQHTDQPLVPGDANARDFFDSITSPKSVDVSASFATADEKTSSGGENLTSSEQFITTTDVHSDIPVEPGCTESSEYSSVNQTGHGADSFDGGVAKQLPEDQNTCSAGPQWQDNTLQCTNPSAVYATNIEQPLNQELSPIDVPQYGSVELSQSRGASVAQNFETGDDVQDVLLDTNTDFVDQSISSGDVPESQSLQFENAGIESAMEAMSVTEPNQYINDVNVPVQSLQETTTDAGKVEDVPQIAIPQEGQTSVHLLQNVAIGLHSESAIDAASIAVSSGLALSGGQEGLSPPDPLQSRRSNAWLPCAATLAALREVTGSAAGLSGLSQQQVTCPGLSAGLEAQLADPVRDYVVRYLSDPEAKRRVTINVDCVTQDINGLVQLINTGNYRAGVVLCGRLLTACGQGVGSEGRYSRQTPTTLHLWYCRLALLVRLRLYQAAAQEAATLGHLDQPDLYYVMYPDDYPSMTGSIVPFNLRVLCAEIPAYMERQTESLDRLYHTLHTVRQILGNLTGGLSEDGQTLELSEEDRDASIDLWKSREARVLYSVGNCLAGLKDYQQAYYVYRQVIGIDPANASGVWATLGRLLLQIGDVVNAEKCFVKCEELSCKTSELQVCRLLLNKGFLAVAKNNYEDACLHFKEAVELQPNNATAINNYSVTMLYCGRLKEALRQLEELVHREPGMFLGEGIVFNLCTMYELESSRALHKKQVILDLVARHKGDSFGVAALKMP